MDYDLFNINNQPLSNSNSSSRPNLNITVNIYNNTNLNNNSTDNCPSCKQYTVSPTTRCNHCHFRPSIDCPKCFGNNTLQVTPGVYSLGGAPLQCGQCDFQEPVDGFLHHSLGDALTFTEAENEPEEKRLEGQEYIRIKKISRKQRAQHYLANRLMKSPDEQVFASLRREFEQYIERYYSQLLAKNSKFSANNQLHSVIKGCSNGLKAYVKLVQRESKNNREQYTPQKQQLESMRGVAAQDYYRKYNYSSVAFKNDTKRFQHRVVHPEPELKDAFDEEEIARFHKWLVLYREVAFMSGFIHKATTVEERSHHERVKLQMMLLHQERTGYTPEQYTEDTLRFKGRVIRQSPQLYQPDPAIVSSEEEIEVFHKWLGYRENVESFTRQIAHLHHKIGRVSDQIHNIPLVAAACLFIHLEQSKEMLFFKDINEYYFICTALKVPDTVLTLVEQIKSELGIRPVPLIELVKRNLTMLKHDLANQVDLANEVRVKLQLETVQQQLEDPQDGLKFHEAKHIAAAVLLNSYKETKGKWSAKFIAQHVKNIGIAAKISQAANAMKYRVSLLCKIIENVK